MDNGYNNNNYNNNYNQNGGYEPYRGYQGGYDPGSFGQLPPAPPAKKKNRFGIGIMVGILITLAAVMLAVLVSAFFLFRGSRLGGMKLNYQEKLDLIQRYLDNYYLGELDQSKLEDGIAGGLLNGTGDKYAQYYSQKQFQNLMEETAGTYAGIGVGISQTESGDIEVYKVYKDSPAEESGIQIKDVIIEADGKRDFEDLDSLVEVVRGKAGTTVDLVILRNGEEIPMTVERRNINMETVTYKMLEGKIGYIELSEFETISVKQFNEAMDALEKEGMTSLILDIRDNPGGDYDTVIALADRLLPEGKITTVVDNKGKEQVEMSDEEHKINVPMVLLVNGRSASASELLSAAIKDFGIATIIGQTTFGKGIVQSIFQLPDGSGMKFTTEEYLSPDGNKIHEVGVSPDIEIEIPAEAYEDGVLEESEDIQLQKAIEVLQGGAEANAN